MQYEIVANHPSLEQIRPMKRNLSVWALEWVCRAFIDLGPLEIMFFCSGVVRRWIDRVYVWAICLMQCFAVSMQPKPPSSLLEIRQAYPKIFDNFYLTVHEYWLFLTILYPTCYHQRSRILCFSPPDHLVALFICTVQLGQRLQQAYAPISSFQEHDCRLVKVDSTCGRIARFQRQLAFHSAVLWVSSRGLRHSFSSVGAVRHLTSLRLLGSFYFASNAVVTPCRGVWHCSSRLTQMLQYSALSWSTLRLWTAVSSRYYLGGRW